MRTSIIVSVSRYVCVQCTHCRSDVQNNRLNKHEGKEKILEYMLYAYGKI